MIIKAAYRCGVFQIKPDQIGQMVLASGGSETEKLVRDAVSVTAFEADEEVVELRGLEVENEQDILRVISSLQTSTDFGLFEIKPRFAERFRQSISNLWGGRIVGYMQVDINNRPTAIWTISLSTRGRSRKEQVSLTLDSELVAELKNQARQASTSFSGIVELKLRKAVNGESAGSDVERQRIIKRLNDDLSRAMTQLSALEDEL
ncbi:MAG: type II toxin-antitoxin system CcdA family antitoxin [Bdellovibrionales bacterium]|nr:type II toxin-antitoxin system CcdA family antitoxin [Bdellovibrionales bacterium]